MSYWKDRAGSEISQKDGKKTDIENFYFRDIHLCTYKIRNIGARERVQVLRHLMFMQPTQFNFQQHI